MAKLTAQELKWRAEDDARTMAEYQKIMQDKSRRDRAVKAATARADELQKSANAMKKVARTKTKKK